MCRSATASNCATIPDERDQKKSRFPLFAGRNGCLHESRQKTVQHSVIGMSSGPNPAQPSWSYLALKSVTWKFRFFPIQKSPLRIQRANLCEGKLPDMVQRDEVQSSCSSPFTISRTYSKHTPDTHRISEASTGRIAGQPRSIHASGLSRCRLATAMV